MNECETRQTEGVQDEGGERQTERERVRPWVLESKNANKNTLHSLKKGSRATGI